MTHENLTLENPVTPKTQEIVMSGIAPMVLEKAIASLKKKAKVLEVNFCYKNWDTSKSTKFERACFLGVGRIPAVNEKTGDISQLDAAFFMDSEKNLFYKCAYQFVKAVAGFPLYSNFRAEFLGTEKISNGNKAETFSVYIYQLEG